MSKVVSGCHVGALRHNVVIGPTIAQPASAVGPDNHICSVAHSVSRALLDTPHDASMRSTYFNCSWVDLLLFYSRVIA